MEEECEEALQEKDEKGLDLKTAFSFALFLFRVHVTNFFRAIDMSGLFRQIRQGMSRGVFLARIVYGSYCECLEWLLAWLELGPLRWSLALFLGQSLLFFPFLSGNTILNKCTSWSFFPCLDCTCLEWGTSCAALHTMLFPFEIYRNLSSRHQCKYQSFLLTTVVWNWLQLWRGLIVVKTMPHSEHLSVCLKSELALVISLSIWAIGSLILEALES